MRLLADPTRCQQQRRGGPNAPHAFVDQGILPPFFKDLVVVGEDARRSGRGKSNFRYVRGGDKAELHQPGWPHFFSIDGGTTENDPTQTTRIEQGKFQSGQRAHTVPKKKKPAVAGADGQQCRRGGANRPLPVANRG